MLIKYIASSKNKKINPCIPLVVALTLRHDHYITWIYARCSISVILHINKMSVLMYVFSWSLMPQDGNIKPCLRFMYLLHAFIARHQGGIRTLLKLLSFPLSDISFPHGEGLNRSARYGRDQEASISRVLTESRFSQVIGSAIALGARRLAHPKVGVAVPQLRAL